MICESRHFLTFSIRDHEAVGSNPATRTRIEAVELLQFHGFFCFAAPEGAETAPPLSGRGADHQVTKGNTAMEENYFQPHLTKDQLRGISAIGLAHMGDAVFELLVRSWLCVHGKATALEALLGWLYLQGDTARIHELFLAMLQEEGE